MAKYGATIELPMKIKGLEELRRIAEACATQANDLISELDKLRDAALAVTVVVGEKDTNNGSV